MDMKKIFFSAVLFIFSFVVLQAQSSKFPAVDKSPLDVSYYPVNYPVLKIQDKITEPLLARVIYSRPQKAGRVIFGELVEYGKIWRLGANEATEVEFYKEVRIGGKKIPKGRYTLYALVNKEQWTMILNRETDVWGSFKYDAKKDVARVEVPVQTAAEVMESLVFTFEKAGAGINLVMAWDTIRISLPITTSK